MKKTTFGLLSLVAAVAFAAPARAQTPATPLSLEVRGGRVMPTGDLADTEDDVGGVESGLTFGANATFHFTPMLGVYAGFTRNRFGVEGLDELNITDQGFNAGLRAAIPVAGFPVEPYVQGGLVLNTFSFEFDGEEEEFVDSDRSLGFEVGAGVGIGLMPRLSLTPQVTYTRYSPKYDGEDDDFSVEHIRLDVGLRFRL